MGIVLFQIDFFLYKSDLKYSGNGLDIGINKDLVRNKKSLPSFDGRLVMH